MADYDVNYVQRAMLAGLDSEIRAGLKKRFDAVAKDVVDAAINDAMKTFEVALMRHVDLYRLKETIEVVLSDRREKP
jgi:hypothetical protein